MRITPVWGHLKTEETVCLQTVRGDHADGLWVLQRGQTVFDAEIGADLVELVLARGPSFAQAEQAVGERPGNSKN